MRKTYERRSAYGPQDLVDHGFKVYVVVVKGVNVSFLLLWKQPLRQSLSSPIERNYGKASFSQFAHYLEIFFYEFGSPLQQKHGASFLVCRRPSGVAQEDTIGSS